MIIIEKFATKCPCWQTNVYQQRLDPKDPKADSRYQQYYATKKKKLMLHSVGCARASANVQADRWNSELNTNAIAHAVIDSNDGNTRQTLRWDFRGCHCGGEGNNYCIGVEMCESDQIRYTTGAKFQILDKAKAQKHCETAYKGAVELFAYLCKEFKLNPMTDILSHKEGGQQGIASGHVDPEHYWTGLGMPYTIDGFRKDVAKAMEDKMPFVDVKKSRWSYDAIKWAYKNEITAGTDETHFSPKKNCTREEVVYMLYKFAQMYEDK